MSNTKMRTLILALPIVFFFQVPEACATDLGQVAGNALAIASSISDLIYELCYVVAIALFAGAIAQYKEHRNNPVQVPINQPITLVLLSIAIGGLPFIAKMSISAAALQ